MFGFRTALLLERNLKGAKKMNLETHLSVYDTKTKGELQRIYDGFAPVYRRETILVDYLLGLRKLRSALMQNAAGKILDVACGTGENFPFFSPEDDVTAVDLSPGMLSIARDRANRLGLRVNLQVMDAEELKFPDGYFDVVISAMSTCTFPDPIRALQEMKRVVQDDGRILLLEHGRSSWDFIGRHQDKSAKNHFAMAGCRWNQEPIELIEDVGLKIISHEGKTLGVFHAIVARPQ
jgi:ubiquinone/menaquinone biosynthesis C-methylase UbiE